MGQALARPVEDIRRAFAPRLDHELDVAWTAQERIAAAQSTLGFADARHYLDALEFAVRGAVRMEQLQHATIGTLCPAASEMVLSSFGGAPSLAYTEMDPRRTLRTDFDPRRHGAPVDAVAAREQFVECEIDAFGDENHCRAFVLELAEAYARARRRAALRAGLTEAQADAPPAIAPVSAATFTAFYGDMDDPTVCRPCAAAPAPPDAPSASEDAVGATADGGYEERKAE